MKSNEFTSVATGLVETFGSTARGVIAAYLEGGERLGDLASRRWNAALKETSPRLTPETRKNAAHAKEVFGGYYARGLQLSASGAVVAVDTLVQVTTTAIERAAAFSHNIAQKTA